MSVKYICDGCGKEEPGEHHPGGVFKPSDWFSRCIWEGDERRQYPRWLFACSRECVEKINEKSDDPMPILPI